MRNKLGYLLFLLFSVLYLLTGSRFEIPFITTLRWVGSGLLLAFSIVYGYATNKKVKLLPSKSYFFIIIALIPTLLDIGRDSSVYSYERIISLFLVLYSLEIFFSLPCWDKDNLVVFVGLFAFSAVVCMVFSIIEPHLEADRMTGIYLNANYISCIALFTVSTSLSMFFYCKKFVPKLVWLLGAASGLYCVVLSASRAGLIALIVLIVATPILMQNKMNIKGVFLSIVGVGAVCALLLYFLSNSNIYAVERFLSHSGSESAFSRGKTWEDVFNIFFQKPIFGWGYGQVGYKVFVEGNTEYGWGMHSSYFVILCEMGIFGTLLFALFFFTYFGEIFVGYARGKSTLAPNEKRFIRFVVLTTVLLLMNAYVESFLFSMGNPMAICFWVAMVVASNYVKKIGHKSQKLLK